jgi:hypothetical protein
MMRSRLARAFTWLGAWTLVGLFFFSQDVTRAAYFGDPTPWTRYLTSWLAGTWLLAATMPAVLAIFRRWPLERARWPRRLALHGALSLVYSAVLLVAMAALAAAMGHLGPVSPAPFRVALGVLATSSFHNNILSYWTVLGIHQGFAYYRRYHERETQAVRLELRASELEAQLVRARLDALKLQLQPHFLFNTMNAIMVLVRQQRGAEAEETIARLSDLLRFVLDDAHAQEVPLHRELAYLRLYVSIEQLRFADRLRIELDAEPGVLDAALPPMALSPLVENAIRHGASQREDGGTVTLTARRAADDLVIEIRDDGPGLDAPAVAGHGIGLDNTRARLHQLYGDRASLAIANATPTGAVVTVTVPFHIAEDAA